MVYVDLLIIQDLFFDYLIMLCASLILNRVTSFRRLFFASTIGTFPLIFLFIDTCPFILLIINIIFSIIMSIISFKYKNFIYTMRNTLYMFMISIFLAGSIYLINIYFYKTTYNSFLSFVILLILAPIITYIYFKSITNFKNNYSNYYQVDIYLKCKDVVTVTSYLDTGNKLIDPYFKKPIILINKKLIKNQIKNPILVPCNTINSRSLLKCFSPQKIIIKGVGTKTNLLIGLVDTISIDGVDCLLNSKLLERTIK